MESRYYVVINAKFLERITVVHIRLQQHIIELLVHIPKFNLIRLDSFARFVRLNLFNDNR